MWVVGSVGGAILRKQKAEGRGQRAEGRGQRAEGRRQGGGGVAVDVR